MNDTDIKTITNCAKAHCEPVSNYLRYAFRHMLRGDKVDYIIGVQGSVIGLKVNGVDTYHVVAAKQYRIVKGGE